MLLITGGAGFIGTHLARQALAAGCAVRILDNLSPQIHGENPVYVPPEGVEFLRGDVTVREDVERALSGVDALVHLAAETGTGQSMYEIDRYYRTNVQGTALLFDVLVNSDHSVGNVLLASSRAVYGEGAYECHACQPAPVRRHPGARSQQQLSAHQWEPHCPECGENLVSVATREDDRLAPASLYAATKLAQEDIVRISAGSLGIPSSILRFQNVFGEGQSLNNPYTGIISIFSTRIRLGLSLPVFEDGAESRDFVHVEDVVRVMLACIENPGIGTRTLNVGAGRPTSVLTVAQMLCRIMDSPVTPHVTGQYRVGDIRHNFADIGRLRALFGPFPQVSLEEGMHRFCQWVQEQPVPEDMLESANAELAARRMMG